MVISLCDMTLGKDYFMKIVIILIVAILVIVGGGAAAIFLTPLKDKLFPHAEQNTKDMKKGKEPEKAEESINLHEILFIQLPEVLINLKPTKGRSAMLKATFIVTLTNAKDREVVDHLKPLIMDQFQTYLREFEVADLQGAAGLERIRQELKNRLINLVSPIKIRQILFKDFLIQ